MLTLTFNTFENIDTKFHIDQRKTAGDMYFSFRGDLLLVNRLYHLLEHRDNIMLQCFITLDKYRGEEGWLAQTPHLVILSKSYSEYVNL